MPDLPPSTTPRVGDIELLLDWIDALRCGDVERVAARLAADATWHGVTDELTCVGREAIVGAVSDQLPIRMRMEALELVATPGYLVLGTRDPSLPNPPDVTLDGQIYNVFELDHDRIRTIRDFTAREHALRTAGLDDKDDWR